MKVLSLLNGKKEATLEHLEDGLDIGRDQIMWAVENLAKQNAVSVARERSKGVMLTEEGRQDTTEFPEEALVKTLLKSGKKSNMSEIKDQIGLSWAKRNGWITVEKGTAILTSLGEEIASGKKEYRSRAILNKLGKAQPSEVEKISEESKEIVDSFIKRGLLEVTERNLVKSISITKSGADMLKSAPKEAGIGPVTREIISNRTWERQPFKPYDVNAPVDEAQPGRIHPMREFINKIRQKWLEMGFIEINGPIIESAFWNFDALFSPQDHPTREMQDTFFLENPQQLSIQDVEALERVRKMHLGGWKERWSEELAGKALMRTQVTALSARQMRKMANTVSASYPLKFFSVGQVFRNESIDYKHLEEFHQYEGIIIGDNLTLANLIYELKTFYGKLGFNNVKIRPSYFPFTEPSLEGYYYDETLGENIELTGAGIIRKEITKALGINKTVLAWGGGVERFLLDKLKLDYISTPYRNNVGWLRSRKNIRD